jgi:hypothetical protein
MTATGAASVASGDRTFDVLKSDMPINGAYEKAQRYERMGPWHESAMLGLIAANYRTSWELDASLC